MSVMSLFIIYFLSILGAIQLFKYINKLLLQRNICLNCVTIIKIDSKKDDIEFLTREIYQNDIIFCDGKILFVDSNYNDDSKLIIEKIIGHDDDKIEYSDVHNYLFCVQNMVTFS